jgi:N6-adenosine-specific RNA methylase IME4
MTELAAPPRAGEYRTLVSDPPWRYENKRTRNAAARQYETMTIAELKRLPVAEWMAPQAHVYLWTTTNFLPRAFSVLTAWGFEYVTNLVWVKPQIGMGNYFRVSHEHVLFGARPPRQRTKRRDEMSWFSADRRLHSAKPDAFYRMVERMSYGPMLDMFSRGRQLTIDGEKWDTWGLQAPRASRVEEEQQT